MAIEEIEGKLSSAADLTAYVSDVLAAAGTDRPSAAAVAGPVPSNRQRTQRAGLEPSRNGWCARMGAWSPRPLPPSAP